MPAVPLTRRRVELVLVPLVAAFCMAFIIGAIVLDRDSGPCPAPTWNNQLTLSLTGNVDAGAVTACSGTECVPLPPTFAKSSAKNSGMLTQQKDGSWLFKVATNPPKAVTFRVYDKAWNVVAAQSTALNWTRISGDERCGGRMASINVVLNVP
ncbi:MULTISPECIES: hypothetical protein [Arthrobacter]|uniref:Uncharacterized protein n=1 Tax=Arthrobacter psychrochitiniphilus TaxID=291045 RepID=A0A2V3DUA9_9MICC|nr:MULTISPECIES: hypothetical protein [Arthrobacter]NYG15551.1 hypothetical protein [Arthrobacter psychrochitiniphilus]PXA66950.1 hypothetical protein CVS29_05230 [Arthrobacter psychrochitiniphilus]